MPNASDSKQEDVHERIESLKDAVSREREYLATGKHADWSGFRPLFSPKVREGKVLPPHKDWVQNVFLPRTEKALDQQERLLERLELAGRAG